ncbi:MAG TPA: hypothetical protein VEP90_11170 [Methylomirabilota bacterium]|nr:hypothetical protein [Methylomirabilota bacterium]
MRILLVIIIIVLSLSNVGLWIEHEFLVSDVKVLKHQVQQLDHQSFRQEQEKSTVKEPSSPNKIESTKPTSPLQSPSPSKNPTKKPTSKKAPAKDFECINRNDC